METSPSFQQKDTSIIIPCYNGAKYIEECLESFLTQTVPPSKIIVIDDGSTDETSKILQKYLNRGAIEIISNEKNQGRAFSVNSVIPSIQTKYIILQDADDIALPDRLEKQIAFMEAHPRVGCSSGFINYINSQGKKIAKGSLDLLDEKTFDRYLKSEEPFGLFCPAVILRTEVFRNPSLRFRKQFWPADDIDLWNRIAESGWQVLAQPETVVNYRIHSTSAVTSGFAKTRERFEFVRDCLRARRAGQQEPTFEEFLEKQNQRSLWVKMNSWRKTLAKGSYRAFGFAIGEKHFLTAIGYFIRAFLLQPYYVTNRVFAQLPKK